MHTRSPRRPAAPAVPLALAAVLAATLAGCTDDSDHDFDAVAAEREARPSADTAPRAVFDPANGDIPFPNSALFADSADGTLNAPVADESDLSDPTVALNLADGFSTVAPISASVSGAALDPATLVVGETVRVFEIEADPATLLPTALGEELGPERLALSAEGGTLSILPLTPLEGASDYAVYLTDGIADTEGRPLGASTVFRFASGASPLTEEAGATPEAAAALAQFNPGLPALEPLRQLTRPLIELIATADDSVAAQDVVLAWSFRTQGIREVLQAVFDASGSGGTLLLAPSGQTTDAVGGRGAADIFIGALELPYYLLAPSGPEQFVAAINSFWQNAAGGVVSRLAPDPVARSTETVPVLATLPNASSAAGGTPPEAGWPVLIFQHGIARNRADVLAVADTMAEAGFATIAIDLPVHGLTDPASPAFAFSAESNPLVTRERSFGLDLLTVDADSGATTPGPDGTPDPSGAHFINLSNLVNSRDNLRQGVADLMLLSASLGGAQLVDESGTPAGSAPLDASRKALLGYSLGGIVGATFLSYDNSVASASLAMPGGGIAGLVAASPNLGPRIAAGVAAAAGDDFGLADYLRFLAVAQTLVDPGDPINHARFLGEAATPVHMTEIVGDESSPPDQTIPNAVAFAPLSGTEPLAREIGLQAVAEDTTGGALVRFIDGYHGSLINPDPEIDPGASPAVTVEMQRQIAVFAASGGAQVDIEDESLIAPADFEPEALPLALPEGFGEPAESTAGGVR